MKMINIMKWILLFLFILGNITPTLAQEKKKQGIYIGARKKEEKVDTSIEWRTCSNRKPLRITTFATNPPFGWTEGYPVENKDEIEYISQGYLVDFLKKIADELHIATTLVGFPTDQEALSALETGAVDIFVGSYYDPKQRGRGHIFITPDVFQNLVVAVFMKGKEKEIKTLDDLIPLKGVARLDEQLFSYIHILFPKEAKIELVEDSQEAFTKLLKGEADYFLSSPYSAETEARRFKINHEIKMASIPIVGQKLFVLYSGRSACRQYIPEFKKKISEKDRDLSEETKALMEYINVWGENFREDPSLREELGLLPETEVEKKIDQPTILLPDPMAESTGNKR